MFSISSIQFGRILSRTYQSISIPRAVTRGVICEHITCTPRDRDQNLRIFWADSPMVSYVSIKVICDTRVCIIMLVQVIGWE